MSLSKIIQIAESKQEYFAKKQAKLAKLIKNRKVSVKVISKQEDGLDNELLKYEDFKELARAAVMETPLAEIVDFASGLGFDTDFRPEELDGHQLQDIAKYKVINSGIFFRRPSKLEGLVREKVLDYAIEALLFGTYVCVASEKGKAEFYKWMSPITHAMVAAEDPWEEPSFSYRDEQRKRALEHFKLDKKISMDLDTYKIDKKIMLAKAREYVDKAMIFREGFSLLFNLKPNGEIVNWSFGKRGEGITTYGPYGRIEQFGLVLPIVYNLARPFEHKEELIEGKPSDFKEQLIEKIKYFDTILQKAQMLKDGYRFGMPGYVIVDDRFNDLQIF